MKCIRELEQGVMLNTFGVKEKYYISVAMMTFFSLDNPDEPLKETEMWPLVQEEIGKETVFDMGMPKQHGEVVVCGKCFTPGGKPAPACPAGARVGNVAKELHVYGPRFWDNTPAGPVPTSPTPFTMLDLTWNKAFGGPGFARNPQGKGHDPIITESGGKVLPLPNVEYPDRPVTSPSDRPEPAGFMPLDLMWPQRHAKTGTYDDTWFRERWPYFPEDFDWTFFNVTPEDQWAKEFFSGEEDIELTNMHPRHPRLLSRLPRLRHRIFIHRLKDWRKRDGEFDFVEPETRLDTVWLFPHRERGVTFSRAVMEIHDDEPLDVKYLFLVTEPMDEPPKSMEHYKEELERRLDRSLKIDLAPIQEAQEQIKDAVDRLKDLPRIIEDKVDEGLGKAPMVKKSPAQVAKEAHAALDQGMANMDMAEKQLTEVKAKFGHMAKVDLKAVADGRVKMIQAKKDISAAVARVENMKENTAAKAANLRKNMEAELEYTKAAAKGAQKEDEAVKLAADTLADFDAAMDMALDRVPGDPWKTRGFDFVVRCRQRLLDEDPDSFKVLRRLGFRPYTLKRCFLGINPVEAVHSRARWGLEPDEKALSQGLDPDALILPPGLVIPRFIGADLVEIRILTDDWAGNIAGAQTAHLVPGSEEGALARALQLKKPILVLPDALQARLVEQEADDMVGVLAMATPGDTLDDDTAALVPEATHVYVAHPEAWPVDLDPWSALHETPEPAPFPQGADLFAARREGLDIRKWVRGLLPVELTAHIPEDEELDDDGFSDLVPKPPVPPKHDIKGLVERLQKKIQDHVQPMVEKAQQERKAMLTEAAETLRKYGKDPKPVLDLLAKDPLKTPIPKGEGSVVASAVKDFSAAMVENRKRIVDAGQMTPQLEKQLGEFEGKFSKLFADVGALEKDADAKLAELSPKEGGKLPPWAQEQLKKAGWEPDDPMQFTRQDVIDRYAAGRTLASKNLQGLDLSGLDLTGVNLKKAILVGTSFAGTNLSGADMEECVAEKADFTKANLQNARLRRTICKKAKFVQADLSGANVTQAMLVGADLTKARCVGTDITEALFEKAVCHDANFVQATAVSSYFIEADVSRADFGQANMERCVFMKATLDGTRFTGAKARQLYLLESKGEKPVFADADMFNSRIINDTNLVDADFTGIDCETGAWFKSKLPGADFRGARFHRSMIEQCEAPGANLQNVKAYQTRFNHTDLTNADMRGLNLFEGSLRKSWITNADLRGANLYGAEFFKTKIGQTRLEGANLKKTYLRGHEDIVRDINDPARRSNAVDFQPDPTTDAKGGDK